MRRWLHWIGYPGIALIAALGGWSAHDRLVMQRRAEWERQQKEANDKQASDAICVLAIPSDTGPVGVFEYESRAREYRNAAHRGESAAALDLILKDSPGYFVNAGTRCSLIRNTRSWGTSEVRIVDGERAGKTGYVPTEWRIPNVP